MTRIQALGELTPHPRISDWWTSQPVPISFFDGKPVAFTLTENDDAKDVSDAIEAFLALGKEERLAASQRVHENYLTFLNATDITPLDVDDATDIWRFVMPKNIFVGRRNRRDNDVYVQV